MHGVGLDEVDLNKELGTDNKSVAGVLVRAS